MDVRSILGRGFRAGSINLFIVLLGLTGLAGTVLQGWFKLSSLTPGAWALLMVVGLWGGAAAVRNIRSWRHALVAGLLAGVCQGLLLAAFVGLVSHLIDSGADVRKWLAQLTPKAIELLTFGRAPVVAGGVIFGALLAVALGGAILGYSSARYRWREALSERWRAGREKLLAVPAVQDVTQFKYARRILYGVGLVGLLIVPVLFNQSQNYTWGTVGIYVILGLGLNIVVGLAGLLDLGYAAFFAIGAYSVALLTAPKPHGILMSFWLVLPIGIALAALSGVLLGIPVLRMRGDYLAIVTLGFGEIIRILSKSEVLTDFTGGPRGVRAVGGPSLLGIPVNSEFSFMYIIVLGIVLVVFVTIRLQHSRVGRAWMAMRDDEDVAQAVGIHTLRYKLLAFAIGAAFAGLGGVLFASRNKFTGPEDFTLLVSINVLCLVIVGGMGSIPGVVAGSVVLKYLPEALRPLKDFRMLAFGGLLVVMMILRPEGIFPPKRRSLEQHEPTGRPAGRSEPLKEGGP